MSYFTKGNEYYTSKDYALAIECYNKSIDYEEEITASYYNAGVCYLLLKDYDRAIIYLKHALDIHKDSKYYFNIGYCYAMKEETRLSYNYFLEAKKLNQNDKDCDKAINLILNKHPEYAEEINLEEIHIKDKESLKETDVRKLELITEDDNKITLNILEKQRELIEKINEALDNNDKDSFMKLSKKLNKLLMGQKGFSLNI